MDPTAGRPAPAGARSPDVRRRAAWFGELLASVVTAAAAGLAVQQAVDLLRIPRPSYVPEALMSAGAVALVLPLLVLGLRRTWPRWGTVAAWVALSALPALVLSLLLHGTRLYLNGLSGDQFFRTQYLGRLADSPRPADMNYLEPAPYYPAGWFWPAGRIVDLAGLEAWAAYKPLAVLTMAVAGPLAFTLWKRVTGPRTALATALVTVLVGLRVAAYEPYSWFLIAALPPVVVALWRALRESADGGRFGWPRMVELGVFAGATAAVYTLLTFFTGFLALLMAAAAGTRRRVRSVLLPLVAAGAVATVLAAAVWTPFVLEVLRDGYRGGAAQHFLPDVGALLPLPMTEPSVSGALCLAGLVWIVCAAHRDTAAAGLGLLVLAVYGWYLASTAALAVGTTLLAFRVEPALVVALHCAAVLGIRDVVQRFDRPPPVRIGLVALALVAAVGSVQAVPEANASFVATAFSDYTPEGTPASGVADPAQPGAWADDLAVAISEETERPARDLVLLTTYYPLLAHHPYRGYQTSIAQYANPLARFDERRTEILTWSEAGDAAELLDLWAGGPFTPPSVLVLSRADDGLHLGLTADGFPREPNIDSIDVVFRRELFAAPEFVTREVGPFTVVVRR